MQPSFKFDSEILKHKQIQGLMIHFHLFVHFTANRPKITMEAAMMVECQIILILTASELLSNVKLCVHF